MRALWGSLRQSVGVLLGRWIHVTIPKRTCIHYFGTRKQLKRRVPNPQLVTPDIGQRNTADFKPLPTRTSHLSWVQTDSSTARSIRKRGRAVEGRRRHGEPTERGMVAKSNNAVRAGSFIQAAVRFGLSIHLLALPPTALSNRGAAQLPSPVPEMSSRLFGTFPSASVRPSVNYAVAHYILYQKHQMHLEPSRPPVQFDLGVGGSTKRQLCAIRFPCREARIGTQIDLVVETLSSWDGDAQTRWYNRLARDLLIVDQKADVIPSAGIRVWVERGQLSDKPILFARLQRLETLRMQCRNQMGLGTGWEGLVKCISLGVRMVQLIPGIDQMESLLRTRYPSGPILQKEGNNWLTRLVHRTQTNTVWEAVKLHSFFQSAYTIAHDLSRQLRLKATRAPRLSRMLECQQATIAKPGLLGIRISLSGRLAGAVIARTECGQLGTLSRCKYWEPTIDFATAGLSTRNGKIGVKVWMSFKQHT